MLHSHIACERTQIKEQMRLSDGKATLEPASHNKPAAQSNSKQGFASREGKGTDWRCFNTSDLVQVPLQLRLGLL